MHIHPVEGDGHIARLYLPDNDTCEGVSDLQLIDLQVLEQVISHNVLWFANAMPEERLRAFFRPSVQTGGSNHMTVYVSAWKDPVLFVNGRNVDSIQDLINVPKNAKVKVEVEPMGVVFYKQKFGIRWILRKAWIFTSSHIENDPCVNGWDERSSVEEEWLTDLHELDAMIQQQKAGLHEKMKALDHLIAGAWEMYDRAKATDDPKSWNEQLENLSKALAKYRSGAVPTV